MEIRLCLFLYMNGLNNLVDVKFVCEKFCKPNNKCMFEFV